jgi:predicted esterase
MHKQSLALRLTAHRLRLLPLLVFIALSATQVPMGAAEDAAGDAPKRAAATSFSVAVPGDDPVDVAFGPIDEKRVIVYLHGLCGDPLAFSSWAAAASRHATLISLSGDERCDKNPARRKWSYDYRRMDARITRAIAAVDRFRHDMVDSVVVTPLDAEHPALIGYSQGAKRVQALAYTFPQRYRRVALIAIATKPNATMLLRSERVMLLAGAWDARVHIREGFEEMRLAKIDARYVELPKARHGEYGPQALEVMDDAISWLLDAAVR